MRMSRAALARCRKMRIDRGLGDYTMITVLDPGGLKVLNTYKARTPQDVARVRRSWMAQYRVPEPNVEEVGAEVDDADRVEPTTS